MTCDGWLIHDVRTQEVNCNWLPLLFYFIKFFIRSVYGFCPRSDMLGLKAMMDL